MFLALIAGAGFQDRPVVAVSSQDVRNYLKIDQSQHLREEEEPSYLISFMMNACVLQVAHMSRNYM